MIERLRALAQEADECEDAVRRGSLLTAIKNLVLEGAGDDETSEVGVGPVTLDLDMARSHGWSREQIDRAWTVLEAVARAEGEIAVKSHPELWKTVEGDVVFVGNELAPEDERAPWSTEWKVDGKKVLISLDGSHPVDLLVRIFQKVGYLSDHTVTANFKVMTDEFCGVSVQK